MYFYLPFSGSDEPENCSCTSNQFDCGDKCLPMEKVCDSNYDCDPADQLSIDELNCSKAFHFTA